MITHHDIEAYLDRHKNPMRLDPALESAIKLGLLIDIVTDALNSEAVLQKFKEDIMKTALFDVVAVNIDDSTVRLIAERKTEENAEAVEKMAVMRRGVAEEFFATVPHGQYKAGDKWKGTP